MDTTRKQLRKMNVNQLCHPSGVWSLSKFFLQPSHPFGVNGYNMKNNWQKWMSIKPEGRNIRMAYWFTVSPLGVWCLSKFFLQPLHPFGVNGYNMKNNWQKWTSINCVTPSGFDVYRNSFYNHYTPSGLMDTTWKTIEKNECRSSPKGEISEWLIDLLSHPSGVWCLSKFFLQPLHPFGVNGYNTKTIDKNERRSSLKGCDHDNESTIRQC